MEGEEDIITQLQNQVVLLTSQFCNYTGFLQQNAPPLDPPLRSTNGSQNHLQGNQQLSPEEYQTKLSQCVTETAMTATTINKVIYMISDHLEFCRLMLLLYFS